MLLRRVDLRAEEHQYYTQCTSIHSTPMDLKFSFWNLLISYAFEKAVVVVVGLDLFYSQLPGIDKSLGKK